MKRIIIFILIIAGVAVQTTVQAQNNRERHKERWEKFRTEKIAYLTTNLNLTPEEAQKFWPIYNQMDKTRSEAQQRRRDLERRVRDAGEKMSDEEIVKLTREYAGNMEKEGQLLTKYNEDFLKILPPKKVLKLYQVEREFRMHLFQKYRDQHRGDGKGEMRKR